MRRERDDLSVQAAALNGTVDEESRQMVALGRSREDDGDDRRVRKHLDEGPFVYDREPHFRGDPSRSGSQSR